MPLEEIMYLPHGFKESLVSSTFHPKSPCYKKPLFFWFQGFGVPQGSTLGPTHFHLNSFFARLLRQFLQLFMQHDAELQLPDLVSHASLHLTKTSS